MKYEIKYRKTKYGSIKTQTVNASHLTKAREIIYDKYPNAIILDVANHKNSNKNDEVIRLARAADRWIIKNRYLILGIMTSTSVSVIVFAVLAYFYIQNDYLNSLHDLDSVNFQNTNVYYISFILFLVLGFLLLVGGITVSAVLQKKKNKQNKI